MCEENKVLAEQSWETAGGPLPNMGPDFVKEKIGLIKLSYLPHDRYDVMCNRTEPYFQVDFSFPPRRLERSTSHRSVTLFSNDKGWIYPGPWVEAIRQIVIDREFAYASKLADEKRLSTETERRAHEETKAELEKAWVKQIDAK